MNFLLDTNVVSAARVPARLPRNVAAWLEAAAADDLYLSVATVFEIEIGVLRAERRDPVQGALLRRWKNDRLAPSFAGRIIAVDDDIATRAATLNVPDPRPLVDSLIAATALERSMTLVTRNERDFHGTGVALFNPWDKPD